MTHEERVHELLYSTESRDEMCERVVRMEELVRDALDALDGADCASFPGGGAPVTAAEVDALYRRAKELGIEVEG